MPSDYQSRIAKSKTGKLYHQKCYRAAMKKSGGSVNTTGCTTERIYKATGTKGHGYRITIPILKGVATGYTFKVIEGGILVYTPVTAGDGR
jgi:hypothetical protein